METQNTSPDSSKVICQELLILLPSYSLGTATPEEERLVEALLPLCPEASRILADYQVIGDNLVALFPKTEEPPSSAALLKRVRANTPSRQRTADPITDDSAKQRVPSQVADRQSTPLTNNIKLPRAQSRQGWGWVALAACFLIALAGTNIYWATQIDNLRREQQQFLQTLASNPSTSAPIVNAANQHRALLPADDNLKSSAASFVWNSTDQIGALVVDGLPPLKQGETYQLWLVRDQKSLSLGTFEVDDKGVGVVIFHSSQPVETFSHIGVNVEPIGGTTTPTSPHLIIGNI